MEVDRSAGTWIEARSRAKERAICIAPESIKTREAAIAVTVMRKFKRRFASMVDGILQSERKVTAVVEN